MPLPRLSELSTCHRISGTSWAGNQFAHVGEHGSYRSVSADRSTCSCSAAVAAWWHSPSRLVRYLVR